MSNSAAQVVTFGTQKLLVIGSAAHKLDSAAAEKWVTEFFSKNWSRIRITGGSINLAALAPISKAAADYIANSGGRGRNIAMAAVCDGRINDSLGIC